LTLASRAEERAVAHAGNGGRLHDGASLVDTDRADGAGTFAAAARSNKPIHTIVNTHLHSDHTGGNQALVKLGAGGQQAPRVMGHENTYNRMVAAAVEANANTPASALPMNAYFTPRAIS
jgi:glyoxylase-like metal-dependent hydrolase (beta-lactamase superfamily II)